MPSSMHTALPSQSSGPGAPTACFPPPFGSNTSQTPQIKCTNCTQHPTNLPLLQGSPLSKGPWLYTPECRAEPGSTLSPLLHYLLLHLPESFQPASNTPAHPLPLCSFPHISHFSAPPPIPSLGPVPFCLRVFVHANSLCAVPLPSFSFCPF